ncbi:MAG: fructosamine kinase family protein [Chryseolinea sp.]
MLSTIPSDVLQAVSSLLPGVTKFENFIPASGGCINSGGKLITQSHHYFLKWNSREAFPDMFSLEAKGLNLLRETKSIYVPGVMGVAEGESNQFLLLEYVEQTPLTEDYWNNLGVQLAALHRHHNLVAGLDHNNYIGSLTQTNTCDENWITFFIEQRLLPLIDRAIKKGNAAASWMSDFDRVFAKLPNLLPNDEPSLLHGDLWRGNVITNSVGDPCVIDPAVYYGHREMDIAMTKLFGGFDQAFYASYAEAYPLIPGFDSRCDLYNLYPLLVHLNLFGPAYENEIRAIVRRFS